MKPSLVDVIGGGKKAVPVCSCRDWILSSVHCLMCLVSFVGLLTAGVSAGASRIVWCRVLPRDPTQI